MPAIANDLQQETKARFLALYEAAGYGNDDAQAVTTWRQRALDRLPAVPFPTRRNENWKYTSVSRMLQPDYQLPLSGSMDNLDVDSYIPEGLDAHRLVFANGVFQHDLSSQPGELPTGVRILPLAQALEDEKLRPTIEAELEQMLQDTENAFLALNIALSRYSTVIAVDDKVVVERPILLLNVTHADQPTWQSSQLFIHAGKMAECTVIESFIGANPEQVYANNAVTRVFTGANAHVNHYLLQQEGKEAFQVSNTQAYQEQDSTFTSYNLDFGGRLVRHNLSAELKGQNTMTNYYGVYMANGQQHVDNQTFIDHALPHCNSNEVYKGIITDKARGVFNGKVLVRQDAQKTNAFQQNDNLVLSDKAVMDAKPQLEIFADDVKCSHGATIGQLDEGSVFYLRSRGLKEPDARAMLQHAFLSEVINEIPIEPLREQAESWLTQKFDELNS
jgi:Fe-S cluster assembly protein SufD